MKTCRGYEACLKALQKIFDDSKEQLKHATQDTLAQIVLEISETLVDFTSKSEPIDFSSWDEIKQIEALDALADTTRQSITAEAVEKSVQAILDSTSQINQLLKKLKSETEKNNQKAQEIRLKPLLDGVEAMSSIVDNLVAAKASLTDSGEEANIAKGVNNLVLAFESLEKAIQTFQR